VEDGLILQAYEDKFDGNVVNVVVEPTQISFELALAVTEGKPFMVNVKGVEAETQPVVEFVTTALKS
jgi:hypothetical protein